MNDNLFLFKRFEQIAKQKPESTAIVCENYSISYGELNSKVNKLSHLLISKGVNQGDPVGLFIKHNEDIPAAILAVAKTGGYYVPLSTDYPIEKIKHILDDCGCNLIITNVQTSLSHHYQMIDINDGMPAGAISDENPDLDLQNDDLAYIHYTSGSTGKPKGVKIEHRNLTYYIDWYINSVQAKHHGQLPLTSSYIFAASVTQIYVPLITEACLHVLPPETSINSGLLLNWYQIHPAFGLYIVPTLWEEHLLYAKANSLQLPKFLIITGEQLKEKLVADTFNYSSDIEIWNLYGPTETVANITYTKVTRNKPISIGKPLEGSEAILLNEDQKVAAVDDIGELCVSGPGVTPGYLNNDNLNKQQFIRINGKRYYKTGDLASYLNDGSFQFHGRKDRQVKVNGVRIELGEIEKALNSINDVRESMVVLHLSGDYDNKLFAYVLTHSTNPSSYYIEQLKETVPAQFIPAFVFTLNEFPKLVNGKTDVKKLNSYINRFSESSGNAGKSGPQRTIVSILQELLGVSDINLEDNLFDLGARSITIIKLVNRLNIAFSENIVLADVYKNPSVKGLAKLLGDPSDIENLEDGLKLSNGSKEKPGFYPLTLNQKTLWIVDQTKKTDHAYNIIFGLKLEDVNFSIAKLQNALNKVIEKNDVLRSSFNTHDGSVLREIIGNYQPEISQHKISPVNSKEEIIKSQNINLLKDDNTPPARYLLITSHESQEFVIIINHIIFDGYSIGLFANKLFNEYSGYDGSLPAAIYNYASFQEEHNKKLLSNYYNEGVEYWVNKLHSNSYTINLPVDFARPKQQSFAGDSVETRISSDKKEKIRSFCSNNDVSIFNVLLSAYSILLHKYCNQDDILISYPYANRNNYHYEELLGYFVNVVLHRSVLENKNSFLDLVKKGKESFIADSRYMECPIELIYPELNVSANPSINPLFQVMFAWHEKPDIQKKVAGVTFGVEEYSNHSSKLDLYLEAQDCEKDILLRFNYNTSIFRKERIHRFEDDYLEIIENIITKPHSKISQFSLVSQKESDILKLWNKTEHDFGKKLVFYDLFVETANKKPNNIAVICDDRTYTYEEILKKVISFSTHLLQSGISKHQFVGVSVMPDVEMLVSIIAIQRIGAAYVPLDPGYPQAKIDYIISHSGLKHIISDNKNLDFPESVNVINAHSVANKQEQAYDSHTSPEDTMYVMYTSGSTGRSKGVVVPNNGVANYLLWMKSCFDTKEEDIFLYQTSINFDISVWELLLPLISGASVVILPKEKRRSSDQVIGIINKYGVNIIQFVPSALQAFVQTYKKNDSPTLDKVFVGGERLTNELNNDCLRKIDAELINLYGPTEASIFCTYSHCKYEDELNVSIGKPIFNATVHILDENFNNIPIGSKGEIFLSGDILANGYFNNEKETNARFVNKDVHDRTMFRTGDIGSFREDGKIDFWGRTDRQVKVRGYRLELSEIENVISTLPEVENVCVVLKEISSSDKRIMAFYTQNGTDGEFPKNRLRNHVVKFLPDYMVPSEFVKLDSLPTLPNGKTDTLSLLKIRTEKNTTETDEIQGTERTDIERKIRTIWEKVLGNNNFDSEDNFFEVGGHSLLLLEMKEHFEMKFDKKIPLIDYYKYTNIKSLAKKFMEQEDSRDAINEIRGRLVNKKRLSTLTNMRNLRKKNKKNL